MSEPFEFEGDEVTDFTAMIPSLSLEADQAYPRGTYLTLKVEVRVRSVRIEEDRKGNLSRKHVLAIEDVQILERLTPDQRRALLAQASAELTLDSGDGDAVEAAELENDPFVDDPDVLVNEEAQNNALV
jgi:hypothetical protein